MKIINKNNINLVKKQIQEIKKLNSNEKIAITSQNEEFNRKILETKNLDYFIVKFDNNEIDYAKQRNSSLNEHFTKLAKLNNITILFDINAINENNEIIKSRFLSRLKQNLMLCNKSKNNIGFITSSKIDKYNLASLLRIIKYPNNQIQKAIKEVVIKEDF